MPQLVPPLEILEQIFADYFSLFRPSNLNPSSPIPSLKGSTSLLLASKSFRLLALPLLFHTITIAKSSDWITFFLPSDDQTEIQGLFTGEAGQTRWGWVKEIVVAHKAAPIPLFGCADTPDDEFWPGLVPADFPSPSTPKRVVFLDAPVRRKKRLIGDSRDSVVAARLASELSTTEDVERLWQEAVENGELEYLLYDTGELSEPVSVEKKRERLKEWFEDRVALDLDIEAAEMMGDLLFACCPTRWETSSHAWETLDPNGEASSESPYSNFSVEPFSTLVNSPNLEIIVHFTSLDTQSSSLLHDIHEAIEGARISLIAFPDKEVRGLIRGVKDRHGMWQTLTDLGATNLGKALDTDVIFVIAPDGTKRSLMSFDLDD